MLARLKSFSLSSRETKGVELVEEDVSVGIDETEISLIGKVFREKKKTNFVSMRNAMMKIWHHKGLCKVVVLELNVYQFVFNSITERDGILQGQPWLFDNQLLVLYPWSDSLNRKMDYFNVFSVWVQVWNIPLHWLSVETGKKIGTALGTVSDVMLVEAGEGG